MAAFRPGPAPVYGPANRHTPHEESKFLLIVVPHPSNGDLFICLICVIVIGLTLKWQIGFMVKESTVHWSVPVLRQDIRWFGAVPLNRQPCFFSKSGVVSI